MPDDAVPNPQQPIVQKLRIRYAKRGRLRFTSHRDFGRAFERAVRRAGIPIAYSSGFNPHPKISYANASPTGAASESEFLEISLQERCEPANVRTALDDALPDGLDIIDVIEAPSGAMADTLEAGEWEITLPGIDVETVQSAVALFLAAESIEVERMTKKGIRTFDCRVAVVSLAARAGTYHDVRCAILALVVRHGTPSVRPDDVLAGLREIAGLAPVVPPLQSRLAQGPLDPQTGTVRDPFASDRDMSSDHPS